MGIVQVVALYLLYLYLLLLLGRLVLSYVQSFSRDWEPHGPVLVVAEVIYSATDPPLKFLRRFIPALRLGSVALDLSFMVLFFVVLILISQVQSLA